jgi:hypothetical protein
MRTKSLILSAMVGIAGVVSSFAQGNVYSVNVVGYINLDLQAGYTLVANQLDNGQGNLATDIIANPPVGLSVYKFNGAGYDTLSFVGVWLGDTTMTLAPGEGAFVQVSAQTTMTFVGEVMQGELVNPLAQGFDIKSSMVPQAGGLQTDLGFVPSVGDSIYQQQAGPGYLTSSFVGVWIPSEPTIAVGEAFWVQSADNKDWTRTFSVQ